MGLELLVWNMGANNQAGRLQLAAARGAGAPECGGANRARSSGRFFSAFNHLLQDDSVILLDVFRGKQQGQTAMAPL